MKKTLIKSISTVLCLTTFSLTSSFPVYATSLKEFESQRAANVSSNASSMEISKIPKNHVYIPAETVLEVELVQTISSKTHKTGDAIELKTLDNLIINDVVVIPRGSAVSGLITKSRKSGMLGRAGSLEFTINSVKTINGIEIPLAYKVEKSAGSDDGAVAVFAAVSIIGGLFMKGKNVSCPAGTKIKAKVTTDTDLGVTFDNLAESMDPNKAHGVKIVLNH